MSGVSLRFWHPSSITGEMVCWWTSSKYSHVSIVIDGLEMEALPGLTLDFRAPKPFDGREVFLPVTGEEKEMMVEYLRSRVGQKYDWAGILSFLVPFVRDSRRAAYCSELAYCAMVAGCQTVNIHDNLSPQEVMLLAMQRKFDMV